MDPAKYQVRISHQEYQVMIFPRKDKVMTPSSSGSESDISSSKFTTRPLKSAAETSVPGSEIAENEKIVLSKYKVEPASLPGSKTNSSQYVTLFKLTLPGFVTYKARKSMSRFIPTRAPSLMCRQKRTK